MSDSTFDPNTFMQQTVDAPMSYEREQVPENEYQMMVYDFDPEKAFRRITWKDKDTGEDRESVLFSCPMSILDESVKILLERQTVIVPYDMFLDFENGKLSTAKGKNVDLGKLRRAVGQNEMSGWSFPVLRGAGPLLGRVRHVPDKNDSETKRAKVVSVAPIR